MRIAIIATLLVAPAALSAQADTTWREQPFSLVRGAVTLVGTTTLPRDISRPVPVAVIVAGSGPTDRNGNGPLVQTDLYLQLAHQLAERGIASVRYDKRGIAASAKGVNHPELTLDDYADDVGAIAREIATDKRFSRVFLIGHSEGAGLVLQAANRGAPVAGVVMMSGIGRRLASVLHDQFSLQGDSATVVKIDSAFARFIRGDSVGDVPPLGRSIIIPLYRKLLVSMAAYDPPAEVKRVPVPVMIVQGGMDLQVDVKDADALRAARPDAAVLIIPAANHVFKAATSRDLAAQQPLYANKGRPIVPELAVGIAEWIAKPR